MKILDLTKAFGEKRLFRNISCDFPDRGIVALTGASGQGKTTLLRIIAGLEKADAGEIKHADSVSYDFQEPRLIPTLTAWENVAFADLSNDKKARAIKRLEALGLGDSIYELPENLSGGMQKRVALARALNHKAEIYLLDEPYNGLDEKTKKTAMEQVALTSKEALVIIVSHNPSDYPPEAKVLNL